MEDSLNVPYLFFTSQGKSIFSSNCVLYWMWPHMHGFSRKGEEPQVHRTGRSGFRQRGQHSCGISDELYP